MKYKTLAIKVGTKYQEFMVYIEEMGEWGTCSTPVLYPMTATMESLIKFYPNSNFDGISLITIELNIIEE